MAQLKLGAIINVVNALKEKGMSDREIKSLPVYIGDDDELNGIHCAWYAQPINAKDKNDADFIELINENGCNIEIKDKAILIS